MSTIPIADEALLGEDTQVVIGVNRSRESVLQVGLTTTTFEGLLSEDRITQCATLQLIDEKITHFTKGN